MNQFTYSKADLIEKFGEQTSVGEIFKKLENEIYQQGQVVCQFQINGLSLDEDAEKRLAQADVQEVEELVLSCQTPANLLLGVVDNWVETIPGLLKASDQLATDIRFKGIEGHLNKLVELIDSCQMLVDSIISIDNVMSEHPRVQAEAWARSENLMAGAIGEVLHAFQRKDYVLLADILEYDLGHSLQSWLENLTLFQGDLKAGESQGEQKPSGGSAP